MLGAPQGKEKKKPHTVKLPQKHLLNGVGERLSVLVCTTLCSYYHAMYQYTGKRSVVFEKGFYCSIILFHSLNGLRASMSVNLSEN